jgi:hypothetical protein
MPAPVVSGWSGRRVRLAPAGKAPPCHGARGTALPAGWSSFMSSWPTLLLSPLSPFSTPTTRIKITDVRIEIADVILQRGELVAHLGKAVRRHAGECVDRDLLQIRVLHALIVTLVSVSGKSAVGRRSVALPAKRDF